MSISPFEPNQKHYNSIQKSIKNEKIKDLLIKKQNRLPEQDIKIINSVKKILAEVVDNTVLKEYNKRPDRMELTKENKIEAYIFGLADTTYTESLTEFSQNDVEMIYNALKSIKKLGEKGKGDPDDLSINSLLKDNDEILRDLLLTEIPVLSKQDSQLINSAKTSLAEVVDNTVLKEYNKRPDRMELTKEVKIEAYIFGLVDDNESLNKLSQNDLKIIKNALESIIKIKRENKNYLM